MLCSRSASLTITTRMSRAMARNILRRFSAWVSSRLRKSSWVSLVTPSTSNATSSPNWARNVIQRDFGIFNAVVEQAGADGAGVHADFSQQQGGAERMLGKGLAGLAHLAGMGARGEGIGLAHAVKLSLARRRLLAGIGGYGGKQLVHRAQVGFRE